MASQMEAEMARFEEEINGKRMYSQGPGANFMPGPGPMPGRGFIPGMRPPPYQQSATTYSAPAIISKPAKVVKPEPEVEKPATSSYVPPLKSQKMDIAAKYSLQGGATHGSATINNDKHGKYDNTQPLIKNIHSQAKHSQGYRYKAPVVKSSHKVVRMAGGEQWEDPTLTEWDPNDYRIFCGDLGNEVTDDVLARVFSKYNSFQKARVVREKHTKKSKGYGFVSFKDPDDFIRAMREMNGKYVGNRPIKLRKSNWKERNKNVVKKKLKEKRKLGYKV